MRIIQKVCGLLIAFSCTAMAATPLETIIVQLAPSQTVMENSLIASSKNLFRDIHLVHTSSPKEVRELLSSTDGFVRFLKNNRSKRTEMPVAKASVELDEENPILDFNDPRASRQWHHRDADDHGVSTIRAIAEFGFLLSTEVIVAVVDTGVDYNHEDLRNRMWKNEDEIPGNGIDDDGNGYVDDIYGIDTLDRDRSGQATSDPMDTHSHGTHVSGIIAAEQNNSTGVAGISGNARIMALRTVPNRGDEKDADVAEAFIYAARNGAKVINCSFGKAYEEGEVVQQAMDYILSEYGTLVIAAAGNDSSNNDRSPKYPASYNDENLMVVASTTSRGRRSYFSNYGSVGVDLGAPGSSVYSTTPRNRYSSMSGTSMAAPAAAGVAAEVLSKHPDLGALELKDLLMRTVTPMSSLRGRTVTGGRIDLFNALSDLN